MPDVFMEVDDSHPKISALPAWRRLSAEVVIGGEIERSITTGISPYHATSNLVIPYEAGLLLPEMLWRDLSIYYKSQVATLVTAGAITVKVGGLLVPSGLLHNYFEDDWVFQEQVAGGAANPAPTVVDEGVYVGSTDISTTGFKVDLTHPITSYDWQLYEYVGGAWSAVVGQSGAGEDESILVNYSNPSALRLYVRVFNTVGAGTLDIHIGQVTPNRITLYERGITNGAPDPVPTGDAGIDTTGVWGSRRTRIGAIIEFVVPGGAPSTDITFYGRIGGVWGPIRNGAIVGQSADWADWIALDKAYERVYVRCHNIAAGVTLSKTLEAITESYGW